MKKKNQDLEILLNDACGLGQETACQEAMNLIRDLK